MLLIFVLLNFTFLQKTIERRIQHRFTATNGYVEYIHDFGLS